MGTKHIIVKQLFVLAAVLKTAPDYLVGRTDSVQKIKFGNEEIVVTLPWPEPLVPEDKFYEVDQLLAEHHGTDKVFFDVLLRGVSFSRKKYDAFKSIVKAVIECIDARGESC